MTIILDDKKMLLGLTIDCFVEAVRKIDEAGLHDFDDEK